MARTRVLFLIMLSAIACASAPGVAVATVIDYPSFASVAGLTRNGSAHQAVDVLRLTPASLNAAGSAFHATPIDPTKPFHTKFAARAHDGTATAARLAFVIQRAAAGLHALGATGDGLGYHGLSPSIAIAAMPSRLGYGGNDISLLRDGDVENPLWGYWSSVWPVFGQPFEIYVDYWPSTHMLRVSRDRPPLGTEELFHRTVDLAEVLGGPAYVGFTAAAGATTASQDVLSWHLDTEVRDRTETTLERSPTRSGPGESVTLTAVVTNPQSPAAVPTGSVQFWIDDVPVGSPVALDGASRASWTTTLDSSHYIAATFNAATTAFSDSLTVNYHSVDTDRTETALTAEPSSPAAGTPVTVRAHVRDADISGVTPTGSVQFYVDGAVAGAPVALDQAGNAGMTLSSLRPGSHTFAATYLPGRPLFLTSQGSLQHTIGRFASETAVTVRPDPTVAGQDATFTATVTGPAAPTDVPTGTVQFTEEDGTNIGAPVPLVAGTAVLVASAHAGSYTVFARYSGDGLFAPSSGEVDQTVTRADTTTAIASQPNPVAPGGTLTITATVSTTAPGGLPPTGTITVYINGAPMTDAIPVVPQSETTAAAQLGFVAPTVERADTFLAVYSGDEDTNPSTSPPLVQTVAAPPVTPPPDTSTAGAGGVKAAGPATTRAALRAMSAPLERGLKRRGLVALEATRQTLTVDGPGTLTQRAYALITAKSGSRRRSVLLATGRRVFSTAGSGTLRLRLTAAGQRAARRGRTRAIEIVTRFAPEVGLPIGGVRRVGVAPRHTRRTQTRTWAVTSRPSGAFAQARYASHGVPRRSARTRSISGSR